MLQIRSNAGWQFSLVGLGLVLAVPAVTRALAGSPGDASARNDALASSSWQLVGFQGGDGTELKPDDPAKYTLEFDGKNGVSVRLDCNRGRGSWTSSGRGQVQFGPLALTRAMCPPGSLHDQIVKQWAYIRSYVLRDGHLFLALMADGGIYEFAPRAVASALRSPVASREPIAWTCRPDDDTVRVTHYETQPALLLIERGGLTRPAFQVRAASGSRYEGDGVLFWEARGEATLKWMDREYTCTPAVP